MGTNNEAHRETEKMRIFSQRCQELQSLRRQGSHSSHRCFLRFVQRQVFVCTRRNAWYVGREDKRGGESRRLCFVFVESTKCWQFKINRCPKYFLRVKTAPKKGKGLRPEAPPARDSWMNYAE